MNHRECLALLQPSVWGNTVWGVFFTLPGKIKSVIFWDSKGLFLMSDEGAFSV